MRWPAALAVVVVVVVAGCAPAATAGPLRVPPDEYGWVRSADVGDRFTDGGTVLEVLGDHDAVIEKVESVGGDGLRLLGARVTGADREIAAWQNLPDYPPRLPEELGTVMEPVEGATLRPVDVEPMGRTLLLGFEVVGTGRLVRDGIRVTYTVDGRRHVAVLPATMIVCTPQAQDPDGQCPPPE